MALSPGTGQLILQAAQGLSQTLQFQAQLAQRQKEREENHAIELANVKRQAEKDKLDLEIKQLQLQRAKETSSPEALARAREAEAAQLEELRARTAKTQKETELLQGGLGRTGGPKEFEFEARANYDTGVQRVFQERLGDRAADWRLTSNEETFNSTQYPGISVTLNPAQEFQNLGGLNNIGRDAVGKVLTQARRDLTNFQQTNAAALGGTNERSKNVQRQAARLEARVEVARRMSTAVGEITTDLTARQLRESGAQVRGPEAQLLERLTQMAEAREEEFSKAFGGLSPGVLERAQSDIAAGRKDDIVAFLKTSGVTQPTPGDTKWAAFARYVNVLMGGDDLATKQFLQDLVDIYKR